MRDASLAIPAPAASEEEPMSSSSWSQRQRRKRVLTLGGLAMLVVLSASCSVVSGAVNVTLAEFLAILLKPIGVDLPVEFTAAQEAVIWSIRIPRVLLGLLVGGTLGIGGAAIQGLFRNPLAEPGLIGTSGGAAMAAVLAILAASALAGSISGGLLPWLVPAAAFLGALGATFLVYRLSMAGGRMMIATMLLAGIAVNSLAGAVTGLAMFLADNEELRTITFWSLGSLAGGTWSSLAIVGPFMAAACVVLPVLARALDALALGEAEAHHLGVAVQRVRVLTVGLVALSVGAAVSVTGIIGFVGLVVPHLLRLAAGPDHRLLMPGSALLGAALLSAADLLARTVAAPAELPLGVVTALIGAPYFLWLLLRQRDKGALL